MGFPTKTDLSDGNLHALHFYPTHGYTIGSYTPIRLIPGSLHLGAPYQVPYQMRAPLQKGPGPKASFPQLGMRSMANKTPKLEMQLTYDLDV